MVEEHWTQQFWSSLSSRYRAQLANPRKLWTSHLWPIGQSSLSLEQKSTASTFHWSLSLTSDLYFVNGHETTRKIFRLRLLPRESKRCIHDADSFLIPNISCGIWPTRFFGVPVVSAISWNIVTRLEFWPWSSTRMYYIIVNLSCNSGVIGW